MGSKSVEYYNSQRCIGCSIDFKKTYFLCDVRYNDGTTETIVEEWQNGRLSRKLNKDFIPTVPLPAEERQ